MESTLHAQYEVIEVLHWSVGDFAQAAYKARESVGSRTATDAVGQVVLLRLLPAPAAVSDLVRSASDQYSSLKHHPDILAYYGLVYISGDETGPASGEALLPGLYAVSEWTRSISLRERIRRVAPFSLAVCLDVAISVTQALMRAEEQGIPHGNVCAEEILLTPEGQVKVADFALGRAVKVALGDSVADEQATRSVARLVVEMLTAEHLPAGAEQLSLAAANPAAPPAIEGIVRKASLPLPSGYGSLPALLADLQQARDDARGGRPLTWSPLATPPPPPSVPRATAAAAPPGEQIRMAGPVKTGRARREQVQQDEYYDDDEYYSPPNPAVVWLKRLGILLLALGVIAAVFVAAYFAMQINDVPSDVTVPNLIGKQFSDAQTLAQQQHFHLVEGSHQDSDTWPQGAIYRQDPLTGRSIKSGKDVTVFVSDGPSLLDVPDLSQTTITKAQAVLGDSGLPVGSIAYAYDNIVPKGIVTAQQPASGSKVSRETAVNLTVSKGPPPPPQPTNLSATSTVPGEIDLSWDDVTVPATYNVYRDGKKIASALPQTTYSDVALENDNSSHSYTITAMDENGESEASAAVAATAQPQNADAGAATTAPATDATGSSDTGTAISPSAPQTEPTSPGAPRQRQFHILFRVPGRTGSHLVQIDVQDTTGTNVVYDEDRYAGDRVDESFTAFGNKVIFRIFIDGKMVKQQTK